MHHQRRKTREDTWRSDELKKHLKSSYGSVQAEDKKPRERRLQRDEDVDGDRDQRLRNKEKEERHKYRESDRERHREQDKAHHEERERDLDRVKERERKARKEKSRERDKGIDRKSKEGTPHADMEFGFEDYGRKELARSKERLRRRGSEDSLEKEKQRIEDRERRHQERKEKEGRLKVNGQTKDKYENVSGYKDSDREHRRRKLRETDQEYPTADKEKRYRERKEQENIEREKRYRTVQEAEYGKERRHRSSKEEPQGFTDQDWEEKRKEKRHRERGLLDEDKERRHRERKERAEREERRKRDSERLKQRRSEESLKHKPGVDNRNAREEQGQEKATGKDRESAKSSEEVERKSIAESSEVLQEDYSANYEEDFEDYVDDFEEEEDEVDEDDHIDKESVEKLNRMSPSKRAEIQEIQKAISAENERVAAFPSRHSQHVHEREQRKDLQDFKNKMSHRGKYIDFITAKQRQISQKITDKQKKRSMELLRLIDLDFSITFSLLDLAPVNEYDMYIRNFGKTNTKQAYVQCNEDCVDRDLQTDEIDTVEKWTQHPGESALVSGGPSSSQDFSLDAPLIPKIDSQKLANFLRSAGQVIAVLLEEDRAERQTVQNLNSQETNLSISSGCFQLNTNLPFLHERKISRLHFSQVQRHVLLTVHDLPQDLSTVRLDRKYIICVWNIWEPSIPQNVLVCEAQIKCCCFSPGKATLVFAGTVDGSMVMWDLRESSSMHHCKKIINTDWIFRSPTFSTDGILTAVNHMCSVQAIEPVPTSVSKTQNHGFSCLESQEEMLGLSFQIASLDENGILNLWVVIELQTVDPAGSQSDLGLIPGGRVKLVHSSAVHLNSSFFPKEIDCLETPQTLNIKFLPLDSNHFVIGTDIGLVIHGTRHGFRVPPKVYRPQQCGTRPVRVTSIDFSPFGEPIFLVGCSDGSIRLHFMTAQYPIMQWNNSTNGQSIVAVRWALTRPTVFFVLDATSNIYIWDLLESDLHPAAKETIQSDKVMDMDVFGEPEKNNGLLGLAFAKKSGVLEIQYIKKKWAISQPEEAKMLHRIVQEAV